MLNPYSTKVTRQHHTHTTREGPYTTRKDWANNENPKYSIFNKIVNIEQ